MYLGRFPLGREIRIPALCVNAQLVASFPTTAPELDVFGPLGKIYSGLLMPVRDRSRATGLFYRQVLLNARFSTGKHQAVIRYQIGSYEGQVNHTFDIIAGGDDEGAVIAMHWYERPNGAFIVRQLDSGKIVKGRNPSV